VGLLRHGVCFDELLQVGRADTDGAAVPANAYAVKSSVIDQAINGASGNVEDSRHLFDRQ
jgi:hypothetical protein